MNARRHFPPSRPVAGAILGAVAGLLLLAADGPPRSGLPTAAPSDWQLEGVVRTADGSPLSGVQVAVVDAGIGALTGEDGRFRIRGIPAGHQIVSVQFIGYGRQWHEVHPSSAGEVSYPFTLHPVPVGVIPLGTDGG